MNGFIPDFDISKIKGAEYNPRVIDDASIERLKSSLSSLGCVKPIIVRNSTIIAGHQRTKALRALGVQKAPVFKLSEDANIYDEVRFNQLHNGTDLDTGDENACAIIPKGTQCGFVEVNPEQLSGNLRASGASIRSEIMKLMVKFGNWGACVSTQDGKVFHGAQYLLACKILTKTCRVYVIPKEKEDEAKECLGSQYGVFSYEKLPKNTYIQTFAQLFRLRGGAREQKSPTYEDHLIPWLSKNRTARVLDFGCGQGDYVRMLKGKGYLIQGLEFFRRVKGKDAIDVSAVNMMVDELIAALKIGRFDAVICDYVLNSVDSVQAESDVMHCLTAFCKQGGTIIFSGRTKERLESQERFTKTANKDAGRRQIEFLDKDGLTALYKDGEWFYQKFHSKRDVQALAARFGIQIKKHTESSTCFQVTGENTKKVEFEEIQPCIEREFNMKISKTGRTLERHQHVIEAIKCLF